jgi:hypothetical protein
VCCAHWKRKLIGSKLDAHFIFNLLFLKMAVQARGFSRARRPVFHCPKGERGCGAVSVVPAADDTVYGIRDDDGYDGSDRLRMMGSYMFTTFAANDNHTHFFNTFRFNLRDDSHSFFTRTQHTLLFH